jgi:hypothetical protein
MPLVSKSKNETLKLYVVIGLSFVFAVALYFRFIHKKPENDAASPKPSVIHLAQFNIPQIKPENFLKNAQHDEPMVQESPPVLIRDVFAPLVPLTKTKPLKSVSKKAPSKSPPKKASQPTKQEPLQPPPSLELKGTIVGGAKSVAIINDQFVRLGDWIDEYQVVWIGQKDVLLDSGRRKLELKLVEK